MMDTIIVKINGKEEKVSRGITLEELANKHDDNAKFSILLAKVNNQIRELSYELNTDSEIEFLDLTTKEGSRVYISGLTFVLIYAVKRLFGKKADIFVEHSLDKGIYMESTFKLTKEKVEQIKKEMKYIVKEDMPITNLTVDRFDAISYFEKISDNTKANVIKYNTNSYINLYRLGNIYDFFYTDMPLSTGVLKDFDLTYIENNGFLLRFPTPYTNGKITPYVHHPNMFKVFNESREWSKIMNIQTSNEINKVVSLGKINDLIKIDETLQSNRLLNVAKEINDHKNRIKIVLIAGPSSSGKTTTSKKLCMYLESFGLHPKVISMDDYFVERKDTPKDENGKRDYECLEAVDLKLFDKQIEELLDGKEVKIPTFNFVLGKKEYNKKMILEKNDIIFIEGIHALDKKVLTNIDRNNKFKIYICPLTEINIDKHNRVSTSDNRILRRIVRDSRTRGHSVEDSIRTWESVRKGEEKYIFPYQDDADFTINSALIYELGVLRTYVEPLLYTVDITSPYYEEARRLMKFLRLFLPIPADNIPEDSILREFIGGSYFE